MQKSSGMPELQTLSHLVSPPELTITLITPILPGKAEAWRRFIQEMTEDRQTEYEASRHRLGITGERAWIAETLHTAVAIMTIATQHPEQLITQLATSDWPFDQWFRGQLLALQGIDLTKLYLDLVLNWPKPEF